MFTSTFFLQVSWNGVDLENTDTPKYLGVTLDRTLSYKTHIHNTKMKLATRTKLLKKLANSRWGTNARTIRTTALALCYSTAEYAAPVWERSAHAPPTEPIIESGMPSLTGCLKPTNVVNLYLLAGISPHEIRRSVCARVERTKHVEREAHSLFGHTPARNCLKSRRSLLTSVQPVHFPAKVVRVNEWKRRLKGLQTTQPTSGGAVTVVSCCCANCVEPPRPQQWGPDLPFFGYAGHADPLDGWRCCSQKRVMSRPIQVRQL